MRSPGGTKIDKNRTYYSISFYSLLGVLAYWPNQMVLQEVLGAALPVEHTVQSNRSHSSNNK